jgi:two-component system sensor histidine kinase UhpB
MRWLLQVDKSIQSVEIFAGGNHSLLRIATSAPLDKHSSEFEAPIYRELVSLSTFESKDVPHLSALAENASTSKSKNTIGVVRVRVAPSEMLAKQWHRILVGSAIAAGGLFVSILFGLFLATGLTRPLATTIAAVRGIKRGNYVTHIELNAGGEIGELQTAISSMAESLNEYSRALEDKVIARTRDLEAARDDAIKSNAEKMRLIQKVNSLIEEERKGIAIEMHDHFNAELIMARLEAQRILDVTSQDITTSSIEEVREKARSVIGRTAGLYEMARGIVRRLRPEVIDTLGLRDAIDEMVRHYDTLHPQCRFAFEAVGDLSRLNGELALTAYRLIQEALTNVVKHSAATLASVRLALSDDEKILRIDVTDNGKGFDPKTTESGIGLIGMRERTHGAGGKLEIDTGDKAGTAIVIELPVHEDQATGSISG